MTDDFLVLVFAWLLCSFEGSRGLSPVSGGYGEGETPLSIPNRAVKPLSADGTWPARARESRSPPVSLTTDCPSGRSVCRCGCVEAVSVDFVASRTWSALRQAATPRPRTDPSRSWGISSAMPSEGSARLSGGGAGDGRARRLVAIPGRREARGRVARRWLARSRAEAPADWRRQSRVWSDHHGRRRASSATTRETAHEHSNDRHRRSHHRCHRPADPAHLIGEPGADERGCSARGR